MLTVKNGDTITMDKMPRVKIHDSAIKRDRQVVEQMRWLKAHGFKSPREAQEAGY